MNNIGQSGNPNIILSSGGPFLTASPGGLIVSSGNSDAIGIAQTVPNMHVYKNISQSIQSSKDTNWKNVAVNTLSFLSAATLGVLSGLAIAGTMVTPVGWAIAGAVLLFTLIGSAVYGGPREVLSAVISAATGFGMGLGIGIMAGAGMAAAAQNTSIANAGKTATFLSGLGGMLASELIGLTFYIRHAKKQTLNDLVTGIKA